MNSSLSQSLLVAFVQSLRNSCKKIIKSEDFTVLSGFLCCDIDGKTQHRFVISEVINRENNVEGHSFCMKVINWNSLGRRPSSQRNDKNLRHGSTSQSPVAHKCQVKDCPVGQTGSRRNASLKVEKDTVKKCLSGPVSSGHHTRSRNKKSNQTFTLNDFKLPLSDDTIKLSPKRNFSSATISISSHQLSPELEISAGQASPTLQLSPEINSMQTPLRLSDSQVYRQLTPSSPSLCEDYGSQIWKCKTPLSPSLNNMSDHVSVVRNSSTKVRVNSSFIINKGKRMSREKNLSRRVGLASKRLYKEAKNCHGIDCGAINTSNESLTQLVKQSHIPTTEDCDISIDSIRPRYLVQHNDELLLPCPNLTSKYNKQLAATKNDNRSLNVNLSSQTSEDNAPNTPGISSILSSIIGAVSQSSTIPLQDSSKNACAVLSGMFMDKLTESDKIGKVSSVSLRSVSSLETDSPQSCTDNVTEMPNHRYTFYTRELKQVKRIASKETEERSSVTKRRQRVLNWMKIFRRRSKS